MAFNKENKVTYAELAPSLQDMLNRKVNNDDFNKHISNNDIHITAAERTYWNSVEQKSNNYTDKRFKDIVGNYEDAGKTIIDLINQRLFISDFNNWKATLKKIAFTGSYNDLKDLPSAIAYSDTANNANHAANADNATNATHANNADYATRAGDSATVGGIRITVGPTAPSDPKDNKEIWFDTNALYVKFWVNNAWQYTGAALR